MLVKTLESYRMPQKILRLIGHFYERPIFKGGAEGVSSPWHAQSSGIRQGCPLSSYLFLLVMSRIFEQVSNIKGEMSQVPNGSEFEPFKMSNVGFSYIRSTRLINRRSTFDSRGSLVSVRAGFKQNEMCCNLDQRCGSNNFQQWQNASAGGKAEYFGIIMIAKADPAIEVDRCIASSRYT